MEKIRDFTSCFLKNFVLFIWIIVLGTNVFFNDYVCKLEINRVVSSVIFIVGVIVGKVIIDFLKKKDFKN